VSALALKFKAERLVTEADAAEASERAALVDAIQLVERAAFDFAFTGRRQMAKADGMVAAASKKANLARSHGENNANRIRHKARVWLGYEADCVTWARRARKELGT